MKPHRCRYCGAPIRWGVNDRNGRRVPMDPEQVAGGPLRRVGVDWDGSPIVSSLGEAAAGMTPGEMGWTNHLHTCSGRQK